MAESLRCHRTDASCRADYDANELVTATTGDTVKTHTYDANGNHTLVETRVNDVLTVTEQTWYDELDRRLRYVRSDGGGPQEESFTYRGASWLPWDLLHSGPRSPSARTIPQLQQRRNLADRG